MTNLAKRQSNMPAVPQDDYDPLNDVGQDELIMPVVKAVQGTSRWPGAEKHGGEWYDTLAETYSPKLRAAILVLRRQRSLFEAGVFDEPPLCSSDDAITPREAVLVADGQTGPTCAECPFSQWGSAGEGRKGQACQFTYSLIAQNLDTDTPFLLRVHGASLKPWRLYMTRIKTSRKPLYSFATEVTLESQTFDAGKAQVMRFAPGATLSPDQIQEMRGLIEVYRNVSLPDEYAEPEQASFDTDEESVLD